MGEGAEPMLTIRDASRATGLSVKALRRRVERGTLPAQLIEGIRRVPISELLRAGLLVTEPHRRAAANGHADEVTRRLSALEARVRSLESAAAAASAAVSAESAARHVLGDRAGG